MKKKTVLLYAAGSKDWIGGLYYVKNVAFQLSQNKDLLSKYNLVLWIQDKDNAAVFSDLPDIIKIKYSPSNNGGISYLCSYIYGIFNNVKAVYPMSNGNTRLGKKKLVNWIPDFQHNRLPENFMQDEIDSRNSQFLGISNSQIPLILSSHDAENDFRNFYSKGKHNVYVMPFVSNIVNYIRSISSEEEKNILEKYKLVNEKFVLISNQFWKHKNHIVVLKAIKEIGINHKGSELHFVFTGYPKDYRNPEYYNSLMELLNDESIKNRTHFLGFIDRQEQIVLMKKSEFLIQPSLFEGWGTVVEDAKVLDKTIVLSDIPVHREQKSDKCIFFEAKNHVDLAEKIIYAEHLEKHDDIEKGIRDMYQRADEYSKNFLRMLDEME